MKTRFLIIGIISAVVITATVVGTIEYQSTYNENCTATDGKITGFLRCTLTHADYDSPESAMKAEIQENLDKISHKYEIDTDNMVTRPIQMTLQVATENIPERTCHKITSLEEKYLPESLIILMSDSLDDSFRGHGDRDNDGFLDKYGTHVSLSDASYLLQKYSFKMESKTGEFGYPRQNDTEYTFECMLEDDSHQYKLVLTFQTHYDSVGRLVFVNFTQNDDGYPILEGNNLTLFTGGFNQTIVFTNNLDHDIKISIENRTDFDPRPYNSQSMTIPAHKVWSYGFRSQLVDDISLQFTALPYDLSGKITVKRYPACMTQNQVVSLYSQVGAYPLFPTYLPEGYSYECGIHNLNSFVHMSYWNDELRSEFEDTRNDGMRHEFFASGGITIDYYNNYILNDWTADPTYDKYERAKIDDADHPDSKMLTIHGEPAILAKKYFYDDGMQKSYNELQIYLDDEVLYRIKSGLAEEQIIKIAESFIENRK